MKCPYCGQEIADGSVFCSFCGAPLSADANAQSVSNADMANNYNNNQPAAKATPKGNDNGLTPENFRDQPTYKPYIIRLNIFGAVMFVLFGLAMLGSMLTQFTTDGITIGYILMGIGDIGGIVIFAGFFMPLNKKVFPQVNGIKLKGVLEVLPAIWTAFGMAMFVVSLVLQGIVLMFY